MVDLGRDAAQDAGQELQDDRPLDVRLAAEVVLEDIEVADIVGLELHGDVHIDEHVDHARDLAEVVVGDDLVGLLAEGFLFPGELEVLGLHALIHAPCGTDRSSSSRR